MTPKPYDAAETARLLQEHDKLLDFARKLLPDELEDPLAAQLRSAQTHIEAMEKERGHHWPHRETHNSEIGPPWAVDRARREGGTNEQ